MALTKIGASLGGGADTISVTQANHGLLKGRAVKVTGNGTYGYAKADTAANAEAIGIIIESDWDGSSGDNTQLLIALSGKITVDGAIPTGNLTAGTVVFLSATSNVGELTSAEPNTAGHISKPMGVITSLNSEMIMVQHRGEVISTAGVAIADNAITLAKMEHGTAGDIFYYDASGVPTRLNKPGSPAGEVLTYASSATIPSWTAPAATGATIVEVYRTHNETVAHASAEILDWQAAQIQLLAGSANTTQWTSSNASKLICKSAGIYVVHALVTWSSAGTYGSGSGEVNLKLYKNRSDSGGTIAVAGAEAIHNGRYSQEITRIIELAVDDYMEVQVYHSTQTGGSGTQVSRNIESFKDTGAGPTRDSPYFSMYKL